ncbi:DUF6048 family protein [Flavobacterium sp.]|uniref:DUF6048 family protein n=1 Tax=Flavobacterium sp. TaxID=239 RepID=UPI0028BD2000|nr:DUF6048 family protein [Flavobacterium sp.]
MKHTLRSIFSIALVLVSLSTVAQEKAKDSVKTGKTERYGLRVGVDLHRLTKSFYDDKYQGFEVVGDYRLTKKIYIAGELGNEKKTVDDDQLNFTTKGSYFKVGFDYNAHENWLDLENMIYAGMRYGVGSFSHQLNHYTVYNTNQYFDPNTVTSGQEFNGLTASWLELVGGVKAEVLNNVYLGFSVRLNYLVTNKTPDNFDNLYIPGFNRTYDGKFGVGFNYTLSYFIPLYKSQK